MRLAVSVAILAFALVANAVLPVIQPAGMQFSDFMKKYGKTYASFAEQARRLDIFKQNLDRVAKLNQENGSPAFGVTKFMDLTPEEFAAAYLLPPINADDLPDAPYAEIPKIDPKSIPETWDWTTHSPAVVTPIKNQEQCGSCWAFSATEQIESVWALAGNTLASLSPQQIVDCDKTSEGCNGGFTQYAYEYVIKAGGLESEADYPYKAVNGQCKFNSADVVAKISAWSFVSKQAGDENSTMLPFCYATAPISVCVDAASWQYYNGGVLKTCGHTIDHCVQITGFTTVDSTPVWTVRNSWGTDWGVSGFIYVPRNQNMCSIAQVATTATAS